MADGSISITADTPRAQAERALAAIADRARRAALRKGLYQPCTWQVFLALGVAGQVGALAALDYCQDADEAADAVQAAALLALDPARQAAAAKDARGKGLTFDLAEPETHARCARSRARREHSARAGGAAAARTDADLPDNDADGRARRRSEPPSADELTGAPLLLLLRSEGEEDEDGGAAIALRPPRPRPRGRPTRNETLERAGQLKLPGLALGGSTTKAGGHLPPPAPAPARPPALEQLDLWGRS